MKLPTKPISSPGRPDKFPPPLMGFLRSNAGSRSRGRSRSSTIFLRKKNNNTPIETQEPSSPKVTCMGQVRVRRASKHAAAKRRPPAAAVTGAPTKCPRFFWWVPNALFCRKIKPGTSSSSSCHCKCHPFWPNWGFLFRRKASKVTGTSTKKTTLKFRNWANEEESESEEEEEERVHSNAFVSNSLSPSTPPRNALLLTRCRSAPYRSSSLASKFWGSPLRKEEETGEKRGTEVENRGRESTENEKPGLQREFILEREGRKDLKLEQKFRFFKELEESLRERIMGSEKVRELKRREEEAEEDSVGPLVLTRCKSEPARTAQKLDPD